MPAILAGVSIALFLQTMWFLVALYVFGTLTSPRPREAYSTSAGPRFTPTLLASPPRGRRLFLFGWSLVVQALAVALLAFGFGPEPRPVFRPGCRQSAMRGCGVTAF
ncbi:MAG TPA: hypothetical protein VN610_05810 [Bryobacteraceae bacterium]|nr:hypothetical protein [Bryobacteraceae bacterium]